MKTTIEQVKQANKDYGHHFFDKGAMRFFNSKIAPTVYNVNGRCFFITSEQFNYNSPRLYTIRESMESGKVNTVGEFQQYKTIDAAKRAIRAM